MSEKFPQILIIPIDNRPVCYDLEIDAGKIFEGAKIFAPDISLLGSLTKSADKEKILGWAKHTIVSNDIDIAILSLDTIAYGGLIPSRRINDKFEQIKKNVDDFLSMLNSLEKKVKIYAFSSIMRISDSYINDEEKSYWEFYGRDLYKYSYLSHKLLHSYDVELEDELTQLAQKIPFEVIEDYLDTRKRNYDINSYYIDLVKKGTFDKLVFAQDDTAKYGFNIEEKELLQKQALKELVQDKVFIKTGADEMALSLLSAAFSDYYSEKVQINPIYFDFNAKNIISRYEDLTIENSVKRTIELCGGELSQNGNSLNLLINAPYKVQDELCLRIFEDETSTKQAEEIISFITNSHSEFLIADIKNANGADNYLMEKFTNNKYNPERFYGYASWNTTGNTLGTVIAIAIIKYLAKKYNSYNEEAFKKTQYIRFLDDWGYQANVREILREKGDTFIVLNEMQKYEEKTSAFFDSNYQIQYEFPWNRTFEIKIVI